MRRYGVCWLGIAGILLGAGRACGQGAESAGTAPSGKPVEEILAVVGGTPILRSQVEEQVELVAEQIQADLADTSVSHRLRRDVLEDLIDNQLLQLEAEARSVKATDAEIQAEVDGAIDGNVRALGGTDGFRAQLEKEGLTEETLRSRYREEARKRIVARKLVDQEIRPQVTVTDEMGRAFFQENRSQLPKKPRALRIQDLFLRTHADTLLVERARQTASEVRTRILTGATSFEDAAATYSDDPRGKEGGVLGRFARDELDPDLASGAFATPVGQVSEPLPSRFGYHLLKVVGRDPNGEWVDLKHILIGVTPSRADVAATRERAASIRAELVSGRLDFTEAIRAHSADPEARAADGDLGWIPIDSFYGDMRAVADTLRVGRISPPVEGDGGFHVFKILGEQAEGNYTYDEVSDQLKQLAFQQAMQEKLRGWLGELRKKYFVENRARW